MSDCRSSHESGKPIKVLWELPGPSSGMGSSRMLVRPGPEHIREVLTPPLPIYDDPPGEVWRMERARMTFVGVEAYRYHGYWAIPGSARPAYDAVVDWGETEWLGQVRLQCARNGMGSADKRAGNERMGYCFTTTPDELRHLAILLNDEAYLEFICGHFEARCWESSAAEPDEDDALWELASMP